MWYFFHLFSTGPFIFSDILDHKNLEETVVNNNIDWLVHYSALVPEVAEQDTSLARDVSITGTWSTAAAAAAIYSSIRSPKNRHLRAASLSS